MRVLCLAEIYKRNPMDKRQCWKKHSQIRKTKSKWKKKFIPSKLHHCQVLQRQSDFLMMWRYAFLTFFFFVLLWNIIFKFWEIVKLQYVVRLSVAMYHIERKQGQDMESVNQHLYFNQTLVDYQKIKHCKMSKVTWLKCSSYCPLPLQPVLWLNRIFCIFFSPILITFSVLLLT